MTKRFHSVREVVEVLGISRTAAYQLISTGALPSVRIGNAGIRVPTAALESFVEAMEEKAMKDTAA